MGSRTGSSALPDRSSQLMTEYNRSSTGSTVHLVCILDEALVNLHQVCNDGRISVYSFDERMVIQ